MKILKTKKYSILSNILKYSFVIMFAFICIFPIVFVNAELGTGNGGAGTGNGGAGTGGTNITVRIKNPTNVDTIQEFIEAIVHIVLVVGVPIAVLAIIYVGFLFVKAQGNPEEITKAKKALMYTLIGVALLLGAYVIAYAIKDTVDQIKNTT